ncbi:uncharacterized protein PAC_17386 [Phialocephala subalpina]|uniref:Zn(2)-C6 fungal-type domain-containing protein n=1 Tax=Phialocephala subalpina TaxID=576137 RepID=A0A1L7XRD0_9HELO|nr:uncharacterized protein PAC_17386 [Phialocephala subalpina]
MPTRKAHRKSRTGCVPCKKRHVKCGEERPHCLNCLEYEVDCNYLPVTAVSLRDSLRANSSPESSNATNNPGSSTIPVGIGTHIVPGNEDLDVSDLELMHFFATVTYATMSNVLVEQELWRTTMVSIGLQHKFLLRGLLAQAAVHISYLKASSDSISYLIKASTHQDIAIAQFRKALETINETNFDAVLAFSCLLPIHSLALAACATTRPQMQNNEQDSLSEFLKAIRLFRSVNRILLPSLSIFTTSTILPLLQIVNQHLPEADSFPAQASLSLLEHSCCPARLTSGFESDALDSRSSDRNEVFADAIKELRLTFAREAHPTASERFTIGIMLIWTIVFPEQYMVLVDSRDPAALAVLAHFAALLCGYEDIWWVRGLGSSMIGIIAGMLDDEWREVMEWPKGVAEQVRRQRELVG